MPSKKLNTTDPQILVYQNELLEIMALGGIKLEGLDRMRTTLKISLLKSSIPPVRHNLDLYNDTQLEKLVRKVAERLEIGTSLIGATLSELTELLEVYRLQRIKETQPQPYVSPKLNKSERQAAEDFLKSKQLLKVTNELIGTSGVIGEELNRLIMYLIFTTRKTEQPLHIISLGASGIGKTHLQEKVADLIPEEDKIGITSLSENAFYYFGQKEIKHKVIVIEDLDGALMALYALRELMSKNEIRKTVAHKNTNGETRSVHLVVEGPICVAGCTTKESIYEDNANRSFLIYLDESKEQDERIMDYQRALSAGKVDLEKQRKAAQLIRNAQRLLEPIKVINPYAEYLKIPCEVFKPRRTNAHYLQFIQAITFYKQFQREQQVDKATGEIYIQTTLEDIAEANELMKEILLRKSDMLSGACRNYFEELKQFTTSKTITTFTNRQISNSLRLSLATVKRHHLQLLNCGLLSFQKDKETRANFYTITDRQDYSKMQKSIDSIFDNVLKKLHQLNGSVSAQPSIEPSNSQKDSK